MNFEQQPNPPKKEEQPPKKETPNFAYQYKPGDTVCVQRSNGEINTNWKVEAIEALRGIQRIVVSDGKTRKYLSEQDLFSAGVQAKQEEAGKKIAAQTEKFAGLPDAEKQSLLEIANRQYAIQMEMLELLNPAGKKEVDEMIKEMENRWSSNSQLKNVDSRVFEFMKMGTLKSMIAGIIEMAEYNQNRMNRYKLNFAVGDTNIVVPRSGRAPDSTNWQVEDYVIDANGQPMIRVANEQEGLHKYLSNMEMLVLQARHDLQGSEAEKQEVLRRENELLATAVKEAFSDPGTRAEYFHEIDTQMQKEFGNDEDALLAKYIYCRQMRQGFGQISRERKLNDLSKKIINVL